MNLPSASVILITHHRPLEMKRCLESFYDSLPSNCDLIVVDGSRDDKTKTLLQQFPRARYFFSAHGIGAARNTGVRASDKDVVVFLDDDAIAEPGWLMALLSGYDNPAIACVCGAIKEDGIPSKPADAKPIPTAAGPKQPITNWQMTSVVEVSNGQGGNMSFRREAALKIGLWDENIYGGSCSVEDMDMFIRLRRAGGRILYTPRASIIHYPAVTIGYERSTMDPRFMYWIGRNEGYLNAKLFLGRREFFGYYIGDSLRFVARQLVRLIAAVFGNFKVTAGYLFGKLCGLGVALKGHLRK
jgi:GT2 family glycosyltransferase